VLVVQRLQAFWCDPPVQMADQRPAHSQTDDARKCCNAISYGGGGHQRSAALAQLMSDSTACCARIGSSADGLTHRPKKNICLRRQARAKTNPLPFPHPTDGQAVKKLYQQRSNCRNARFNKDNISRVEQAAHAALAPEPSCGKRPASTAVTTVAGWQRRDLGAKNSSPRSATANARGGTMGFLTAKVPPVS
jgi:hypothetical protein